MPRGPADGMGPQPGLPGVRHIVRLIAPATIIKVDGAHQLVVKQVIPLMQVFMDLIDNWRSAMVCSRGDIASDIGLRAHPCKRRGCHAVL
jgi:hypothetical protein